MPVTKQAIKKVRADRRKTIFNLKIKKAYKEAVLLFRKNPTKEKLLAVYRAADRAAKKNVIHRNKAARIKSRLSKMLTKATKPQVSTAKPSKTQ